MNTRKVPGLRQVFAPSWWFSSLQLLQKILGCLFNPVKGALGALLSIYCDYLREPLLTVQLLHKNRLQTSWTQYDGSIYEQQDIAAMNISPVSAVIELHS